MVQGAARGRRVGVAKAGKHASHTITADRAIHCGVFRARGLGIAQCACTMVSMRVHP